MKKNNKSKKKYTTKEVESINFGDKVISSKDNGYIIGVDLAKGKDYTLNIPYLDRLLRDED